MTQAVVLLASLVVAIVLGIVTARRHRSVPPRGRAVGRLALAVGLVGALGPAWNGWCWPLLRSWYETSTATQDVQVIRPDGTGAANLTNSLAAYRSPSWSPDGARIAFTVRGRKGLELHVVRADGSGQLMLAGGLTPLSPFAWSPDSTKLAFGLETGESSYNLSVVQADASGRRSLTDGDRDRCPLWSPDGRHVAFARNSTIHVVNSDGRDLRELGAPQDYFQWAYPEDPSPWSPDGRYVATTAQGRMCVADVEGRRIAETREDGAAVMPIWSPEGRRVAFCSCEQLRPSSARLLPPATSRLHLTDPAAIEWDRAVLVVNRGYWRLDLRPPHQPPLAELPGAVVSWRWAPKGDAILALTQPHPPMMSRRPGQRLQPARTSLWAINVDGSPPRQLASLSGQIDHPR
jgi:dipeptidyl aminopeptidase/acylaminoacyl peptidase